MRIGIGIPNSIPGGDGKLLLEWARRADRLGFSTLATIGRVAYPSYDELIVLSAAAAATERIGLMTDVLLGPTRNPVLLARRRRPWTSSRAVASCSAWGWAAGRTTSRQAGPPRTTAAGDGTRRWN